MRVSDKELKAGYRRQIDALRALWNAFDPIGVMENPDWPRDEYDRYLPHSLRLLVDEAGTVAIARYIENMARDEMGMPVSHSAAVEFARKLQAWFANSGRMSDD